MHTAEWKMIHESVSLVFKGLLFIKILHKFFKPSCRQFVVFTRILLFYKNYSNLINS